MSIEVKVPALPESVSDATVAAWHKQAGDEVSRDENLVDLETDKVMLEVPAPEDGVLGEILKEAGDTVNADEVLAVIEAGDKAAGSKKQEASEEKKGSKKEKESGEKAVEENKEKEEKEKDKGEESEAPPGDEEPRVSPAARRLAEEEKVDLSRIEGSGRSGMITKGDVQDVLESGEEEEDEKERGEPEKKETETRAPAQAGSEERPEKRVPMSRIRARIAERMVQAQTDAAMLTSFNEIDLKAVMDMRKRYKEQFEKEHGVKLGLMSFFVRACCEALKRHPIVNASVENGEIVYHQYYDVGIAVSTERGLVVPVLRDVDRMSLADIEEQIAEYARKAREGGLAIEDLQGGTFTITNGGVFGSLVSTPILNPPQSAILGMHAIKERPVVEEGEIVARPMMYVALTYDHRIIDGRDAVLFLVAVKELLEDPSRILLNL